jgi:hypothetical protein
VVPFARLTAWPGHGARKQVLTTCLVCSHPHNTHAPRRSLAACLRELLRRQRCCRRKPAVAPSSSLGAAAADGWRYGGGGSKEAVCYAAQPEPVGAGGYGGLHHMPAAAGGPSHPPSPRPAF